MATSSVSEVCLAIFQKYSIDLKDFTKARIQYTRSLNEIVLKQATGDSAELSLGIEHEKNQLKNAWEEYVGFAQNLFKSLALKLLEHLITPDDKEQKHGTNSEFSFNQSPGSEVLSTSLGPDSSPVVPEQSKQSAGVPSSTQVGVISSQESCGVQERAVFISDFCNLCEKWYFRNETFFELPFPAKIAEVAFSCISSASRLYRLLGLQLARICAANIFFTRTFFEMDGATELVGLCGDRELFGELEYFQNYMEVLLQLIAADPKAYPLIPFGWLYRINFLIDPQEQIPDLPAKRRSHAVRIALQVLRTMPAQGLSANMHTLLLRCCVEKALVTDEEVNAIVKTILELFDHPQTRAYISTSDISVLFAPFFDTHSDITSDYLSRLNCAKNVIAKFMSTWVGALWISTETTCLRTLIDVLHLPGIIDRKMVILTLFNRVLLRLAPHRGMTELDTWTGLEDEKRKRQVKESTPSDLCAASPTGLDESNLQSCMPDGSFTSYDFMTADEVTDFIPTTKAIGYHVMDPLLGQVLLTLNYHGLPLALISVLQSDGKNRFLIEASGALLQEIYILMDTVLPNATAQSLHESLNKAVGMLAHEGNFFVGGLASQLFHTYRSNRNTEVSPNSVATNTGKASGASLQAMSTYSMDSVEMDETTFQTIVSETHVHSNANFKSWNYDLLLLLTQGPMRNMERFRWTRDNTKLFKALLSFYRPSLAGGSPNMGTLSKEECTLQICILGVALIDLLLSSHEGTQLLEEYDFTKTLATMLSEVACGEPRILDSGRVRSPIGETLIHMLGRFSFFAHGLFLLRQYGLFELITRLFDCLKGARVTEPEPEDTLRDVCHHLLQRLYTGAVSNYGVCEEIRRVFRAAFCNEESSIRLCAALQLKKSLWKDLSTSMKWGIEMLAQALHDDFFSVVECAFKLLLSICLCSEEALDYLISLFPTVLMESELIREHEKDLRLDLLLYLIAGRPSGFRFLQCYGWIETELRRWDESESLEHMRRVEKLQSGEGDIMNHGTSSPFSDTGNFHDFRRRHIRTASDPLTPAYRSPAGQASHVLPVLTASAIMGANFFPIHFAAVLCRSTEGCTLFKHSDLWIRSVKCLLSQPLPPAIVFEDSNDDAMNYRDSDDEDDEEMESSSLNFGQGSSQNTASNMPHTSHNSDRNISKSASELQNLKETSIPCSTTAKLISATRGYKSRPPTHSQDCVGDIVALKDAILCVAHVGSSDIGFTLVNSIPELLKRIYILAHFSSTLSVRACSFVAAALMARCSRSVSAFAKTGFVSWRRPYAYVSSDGVPYAVSFVHSKNSHCASNPRVTRPPVTPSFSQIDERITECMKTNRRTLCETLFLLLNPVNREAGKRKLYDMMKRAPRTFLELQTKKLLLEFSDAYRMQHAERKFIIDLIENAQTRLANSRKAT